MEERRVGLDSQCFSYLLDVLDERVDLAEDILEVGRTLVRCWLYRDKYLLTQKVVDEYRAIRKAERLELHASFNRVHFFQEPVRNQSRVEARFLELKPFHSGLSDCRILAEAEDSGFDVLLMYDKDFCGRLASRAQGVALMKPADYWASLAIPRGTQPKSMPTWDNPLSKETWWRW
ncbi:hypothetical protein [Corallococcus macrosporus]|uniref:PIN domain-containing protein n=1 Tax=Myxococcus fulvus (strain ATCC BAA-855 / HW-1) TaxID=483219 RepID=F8C9N6_MYXFH|nr:hypothetical protein [Corallococcus macrosporus]AEI68315.1 hypothetical protein LILAB_32170 [Corallococcus macrosporus]